jgi:hypothetical protein
MALILDSVETTSPISYYFDNLTYTASETTGLRFDTPDSIGGTFIFDEQLLTGGGPGGGGATGAAMYRHLQNLGIY